MTIKLSQRQVGGQNERVRPGYFLFKKSGFSIGDEWWYGICSASSTHVSHLSYM